MNYIDTIESFAARLNCRIVYKNEQNGILKIDNQPDGINNLIIGIAPPILIMEQYLFSFRSDNAEMFKKLLQKNRDTIHGAFVISEDGNKVLFRYTMQLGNIDFIEFEGAINSLGLLLSEYAQQIIDFSKL
ncbi:type III secretion system chaperone family protein [Chitinophaga japonensis]|uniref:Putative sensory transduction regulator n=1 Tax=Chitinophaga japonensis TaxID=104662 RepID=A0A562T040_CHIJA|nr:YbjN domain-containing protein [Chitinophaga japonensis]TWI86370.1 putative sensory transduction regulator [Chitinophaga japonensis]